MAKRPTPFATKRAGESIGTNLATWRRLLGLPAQVVAERAGISVSTLSRLENGDTGVGLAAPLHPRGGHEPRRRPRRPRGDGGRRPRAAFLNVAGALGVRDALVTATDPYETDLGRARADQALPKRIRR